MCTEDPVATPTHEALFYRGAEEYVRGVLTFVGPGLSSGEPVAVAVPGGKAGLLGERLGALGADVEFLDMVELGRNPARIIPAVQGILERHGGRMVHYVGEPIWPGRSAEEIREATRHEALINLAWPGARIRVLCPYDAASLPPGVLADAARTHPYVIRNGEVEASAVYDGPVVPVGCEDPLPPPPSRARSASFGAEDLRLVRSMVAEEGRASGLDERRMEDVVVAVNELATNTIRHAGARGLLRVWSIPGRLICQVEDPGHIRDPLAGRRTPRPGSDGGLGLWIVNQLCDLVEARSTSTGTMIRIHAAA